MKWKDHRRLILAAKEKNHVPYSTYKGLMEGVIYPDKTNSWRRNHGKRLESHHHPNKGKIVKLILQSRIHWLEGKENDAGFQLGRALHYIHDGLVSKGFIGLFHSSNENKIHSMNLNDNKVDLGLRDSLSDPFYIEDVVQNMAPQNPEKAIDKALYITASLIKAVLNYQTIPSELVEEYKCACLKHTKYLKAGIGFCIVTLLLASVRSFSWGCCEVGRVSHIPTCNVHHATLYLRSFRFVIIYIPGTS